MKAEILQRACAHYFSKKGYLVCREVSLDTEERIYWGNAYKVTSVKTVRADFIAMKNDGHMVIVETKSGMPDFHSDHKWHLYRPFCEQFYFCADEKTAPKILEELKRERKTFPILWLMATRNSGFYQGYRVHGIWNDEELLEIELNENDVF